MTRSVVSARLGPIESESSPYQVGRSLSQKANSRNCNDRHTTPLTPKSGLIGSVKLCFDDRLRGLNWAEFWGPKTSVLSAVDLSAGSDHRHSATPWMVL